MRAAVCVVAAVVAMISSPTPSMGFSVPSLLAPTRLVSAPRGISLHNSLRPLSAPLSNTRPRAARAGSRSGGGALSTSMGFQGTGIYLWSAASPALIGIPFNTVLALALFVTKKYKSALTTEGLVHAWVLGMVLWSTLGFAAWSTCVVYLAGGVAATRVRKAEKEALGIAEARGGARGPENLWGSAATGAICALLAVYSPWDSAIFKLGFAASLATKLSDTMASEIGKAYGKTTYLITTMKLVPAGTEGAVSMEGTLAGVVGSAVIGLYAWFMGLVDPLGFLLCLVAAVVATTCESLIGATVQGKYSWMTNEVVNFINTAIGAVVAIAGFVWLR